MQVAATSKSERTPLRTSRDLNGREKGVPKIPYFNGSILTAGDQPLALAMEADCGDVAVVALENRDLRTRT